VLDRLQAIAALAGSARPDAAAVAEACAIIRDALAAEDAYVVRAGDPAFVRIACDCDPTTYEIKQKGYWLIWRECVTHGDVFAGQFDVEARIASPGRPIRACRPSTHAATLLPGDESNAEMLVVRGPWPSGLTDSQLQFLQVARPVLAQLVSAVLDQERTARQRAQLAALADIARAFSEAGASDNVLDAVATALAKASGADWVTMNVYDSAGTYIAERAMNVARHSGTETASMFRDGNNIRRITRADRDDELFGLKLVRQGGPVLLPNVFDESRDAEPRTAAVVKYLPGLRKYWERAHVLSAAMFAIVFQERVIGELSFSYASSQPFDRGQVEFLEALVSQAATTIKGTRLFRDLEASQQDLRISEERFRSLVQNASDLVTVIEADTTITYQSPSIARVLGFAPDDVIGRRLADLVHADDRTHTLAVLHDGMSQDGGTALAEARVQHANGSWRHIEFVGTNQFGNPAINGFVLNIRDVTERNILEEQLRHQALHDPLTQLANRTRFADRLEHALLRAERSGLSTAVIFMDLDNFKAVNDGLGHSAGDALLTRVAERMQASLRPGDTVARLGGDEFAVLIEDVRAERDATDVAQRIFDALEVPFDVEGKQLVVRASAGIALGLPGSHSPETLMRDADVAMYVAKAQGKGCYQTFETRMQESMMERLELIADLQHALEREEFLLQYQPMMLLRSGRLYGVEALVRWRHPEHGVIPPGEFIPLAEECGVILGLGRWVINRACSQAAEWQGAYPAADDWTISVNVSVKQLQSPTFASEVRSALDTSGLQPNRLMLEITESVMMQDADLMLARLRDLKDLGVGLAIDDFGTGYSSLSYLRQFPFDLLKIDKSFIDDVGANPTRKELTQAIIELGKTLDLELVAEGIERGAQLDRLRDLDCDLGQGFFFAQPMDVAGVEQLLRGLEDQAETAA
jgi:diguanylate cyclase (GGDEF)-like protein/PAS domain S-box-containing protein